MTKPKLSIFNYLLPLLMIVLGLRHGLKHGVDSVAIIPIVLGIFALYMALFNHILLQQVLNFLTKVWYPMGQAITLLLLSVTFYLIFAPIGLLLRLLKKDILNRDFKNTHSSYWIERSTKQETDYTQQF